MENSHTLSPDSPGPHHHHHLTPWDPGTKNKKRFGEEGGKVGSAEGPGVLKNKETSRLVTENKRILFLSLSLLFLNL